MSSFTPTVRLPNDFHQRATKAVHMAESLFAKAVISAALVMKPGQPITRISPDIARAHDSKLPTAASPAGRPAATHAWHSVNAAETSRARFVVTQSRRAGILKADAGRFHGS